MLHRTEKQRFRLSTMRAALRRYAGPGVVGLFGIGQSVSSFQSPIIGFFLMGVAVLWAAWYLWESRKRRQVPPALEDDRLAVAIYGEEQKEREKRARQHAKENVDLQDWHTR
jgi:hypothetical protein